MITPDQLTPALVAWMLNPDGNSDDYALDDFDDLYAEDGDGWTRVEFTATSGGSGVLYVEVTVPAADDYDGDDLVKTFRVTVDEVPA